VAFSFTVSAVVPATPQVIYDAWLDGKRHGAMNGGGPATASKRVGGAFTAWDGYINGKNLALEPGKRIVQSWRTTQFTDKDADSQIDVTLAKVTGGTKVTLKHTNVPDGHDGYKSGWTSHYFEPMKKYFAAKPKKLAAKKPAKKK
jgi:activator of HSP90 ATPase